MYEVLAQEVPPRDTLTSDRVSGIQNRLEGKGEGNRRRFGGEIGALTIYFACRDQPRRAAPRRRIVNTDHDPPFSSLFPASNSPVEPVMITTAVENESIVDSARASFRAVRPRLSASPRRPEFPERCYVFFHALSARRRANPRPSPEPKSPEDPPARVRISNVAARARARVYLRRVRSFRLSSYVVYVFKYVRVSRQTTRERLRRSLGRKVSYVAQRSARARENPKKKMSRFSSPGGK